jgi:hypothetical protein
MGIAVSACEGDRNRTQIDSERDLNPGALAAQRAYGTFCASGTNLV